jgi:hypothetical protein
VKLKKSNRLNLGNLERLEPLSLRSSLPYFALFAVNSS